MTMVTKDITDEVAGKIYTVRYDPEYPAEYETVKVRDIA